MFSPDAPRSKKFKEVEINNQHHIDCFLGVSEIIFDEFNSSKIVNQTLYSKVIRLCALPQDIFAEMFFTQINKY